MPLLGVHYPLNVAGMNLAMYRACSHLYQAWAYALTYVFVHLYSSIIGSALFIYIACFLIITTVIFSSSFFCKRDDILILSIKSISRLSHKYSKRVVKSQKRGNAPQGGYNMLIRDTIAINQNLPKGQHICSPP